jgi:hypothetical protein
VSVVSGTVGEEREFGEYCGVAIGGCSADIAASVNTGPVTKGDADREIPSLTLLGSARVLV